MKVHMRGELSNLGSTKLPTLNLDHFSIEVQANLLLESYRGTTDWEDGATLADAIAEIESTLQGEKGIFVPEASGVAVDEAGKGYATQLIRFEAGVFLAKGFKTIHLFVTDVNPARKIYENLGFAEISN